MGRDLVYTNLVGVCADGKEPRVLHVFSLISFLAVQVIFICVYITNYLHFITMFLSF